MKNFNIFGIKSNEVASESQILEAILLAKNQDFSVTAILFMLEKIEDLEFVEKCIEDLVIIKGFNYFINKLDAGSFVDLLLNSRIINPNELTLDIFLDQNIEESFVKIKKKTKAYNSDGKIVKELKKDHKITRTDKLIQKNAERSGKKTARFNAKKNIQELIIED